MKAVRIAAAAVLTVGLLLPQTPPPMVPRTVIVFVCPKDAQIRSNLPGTCPRCGRKLVESVPDPVPYHLEIQTTPIAPEPGRPLDFRLKIRDPWANLPVTRFDTVHEALMHTFIVSRDLQFFEHRHPKLDGDTFEDQVTLPRPGLYRVLADFNPDGATPQLLASSLFVRGTEPPAPALRQDLSAKTAENLEVTLNPDFEAVAGASTRLQFKLNPDSGIEPYLGAWAHMAIASEDLIDLMHTHPSAGGGASIHFTVIFPRSKTYRVWVQFQRNGVIAVK